MFSQKNETDKKTDYYSIHKRQSGVSTLTNQIFLSQLFIYETDKKTDYYTYTSVRCKYTN